MTKKRPKQRPKKAGVKARSRKTTGEKRRKAEHESSTGAYHKKVLRDAVHDLISLESEDRFILDLIDTKEFQRLRRIRQLGLAYFVYPSAEHSRFVHALGVFNFARRMINQLLVRHHAEESIKKPLQKHSKAIKAAALLHDLGHGPFSHVFERVFDNDASMKHEQWTCEIIRDQGTDVHKKLVGSGIDVNEVCTLVWDKAHEKYDEVHEVRHYFIRDIVSSQLDADRMDYLLRDSLFTGARYGRYDSEWIMNAVAIGEPYKSGKLKLCLDASKGTGAINEFLIARLLMTEHVYGHKTTRAYESELCRTLQLAAALGDNLPEDTPAPIREFLAQKGTVPVETYLMLDDEVTWWALRRWAACKSFPATGRSKEIAEALQRHALRLVRRDEPWGMCPLKAPQDIFGVEGLVKQLGSGSDKEMLAYECFVSDDAFLPYKDLGVSLAKAGEDEEGYYNAIFLLAKDGSMREHGEDHGEPLIEALTKERSRCRFFYNREHKEEFARRLKDRGVCLV